MRVYLITFFQPNKPYKFYEFKEAYDKVNYIYIARNLIHRNPIEYNSAYEKSFTTQVEKEIKETPLKAAIKMLQYFNDFVFKYIESTINKYHFNIQFASSIEYNSIILKDYLKAILNDDYEAYSSNIKSSIDRIRKNPAVDKPILVEIKDLLDKIWNAIYKKE